MPKDAYHHLGPWTELFKLQRCPTHELGDVSDLALFFRHWESIKAGIPNDTRGSDLWPDILYESFMLIDPEKKIAESFIESEWMKRTKEKNKE